MNPVRDTHRRSSKPAVESEHAAFRHIAACNPAIQLTAVHAGYGPTPVLSGMTISIGSGRLVAVIGANGSGKTTLLRAISGVLPLHSGSVTVLGSDLTTMSRTHAARFLAHVPQFEHVTFPYTVREMVLLGRHPWRSGTGFESPHDERLAHDAMHLAGIPDLADRHVTELSGGELHRASIARALAQTTPVLLLDEPNAHLDLRHQHELFGLLRYLVSGCGRTVLCVTHDLTLAAAYVDEMILLADGRTAVTGSPDDVLTSTLIERHFHLPVNIHRVGRQPVMLPASDVFIVPEGLDRAFLPITDQ